MLPTISSCDVNELARRVSGVVSGDLGLGSRSADALADRIVAVGNSTSVKQMLEGLRKFLRNSEVRAAWNLGFATKRAPALAAWLQPFIRGRTLELLCGSGAIGRCLADARHDIHWMDRRGVPEHYAMQAGIPVMEFSHDFCHWHPKAFDTVLLITELHHHSRWRELWCTAQQLARQQVIVVENCVRPGEGRALHYLVDLFFNRALNHSPTACPGTHAKPERWLEWFQENGDVIAHESRASIPCVPISHDLFVIDVSTGRGLEGQT